MKNPLENSLSPIDPGCADEVLPAGGGHLPGLDKVPVKEPIGADEHGMDSGDDKPRGDDIEPEGEGTKKSNSSGVPAVRIFRP